VVHAHCYSLVLMALEHEELRRRLAAARELVGLDQTEMGERLKASGLGVTDAKRLERNTLSFSDSHLDAYVRITGLPRAWFEAEDWRRLIYAEGSPTLRQLKEERDLAQLALVDLRDELQGLRRSQHPAAQPAKDGDTG
jgi:triphosphoribosyl-dephospho-CoA synthetase